MGSRHNRKRTRSRPRNRCRKSPSASASPLVQSSPSFPVSPLAQRPANFWHQPYSQLQERLKQQKALQEQHMKARDSYERAMMEVEQLRMFGGEAGDEVSLCKPMLDVVMTLFNGNIDYKDP